MNLDQLGPLAPFLALALALVVAIVGSLMIGLAKRGRRAADRQRRRRQQGGLEK